MAIKKDEWKREKKKNIHQLQDPDDTQTIITAQRINSIIFHSYPSVLYTEGFNVDPAHPRPPLPPASPVHYLGENYTSSLEKEARRNRPIKGEFPEKQ